MRAFRVSVRHTVSHESRVICDIGACVPCVGCFARACDCEAERLRARGFSFTAALQLSRPTTTCLRAVRSGTRSRGVVDRGRAYGTRVRPVLRRRLFRLYEYGVTIESRYDVRLTPT